MYCTLDLPKYADCRVGGGGGKKQLIIIKKKKRKSDRKGKGKRKPTIEAKGCGLSYHS